MTSEPDTKDFPFTDEDFVLDEILLVGIAEHLKPEAAVRALDAWRDRFVKEIDEAVLRYKAEATAKVAAND